MYTYFKCGDFKFRTLEEALTYSIATGDDIQELTSKTDPFVERLPKASKATSWMIGEPWNGQAGYLSTPQDKLRTADFDANNIGKSKVRFGRPPHSAPG
ncbi:MAG: hypothetical protein H7Y22_04055 [Gemmatimonadaceae bacterium]|nr:hypothetical protein [Gloeobacterales cyanobacterium ES-bin-141]